MTSYKALVISIVSWNTCNVLRKCLDSIYIHCDREEVEVIVLDNASTDGTPEMVEATFPWVRLIRTGANLGFGRANNIVRLHSSSRYVMFLNPDTELIDSSYKQMLQLLNQRATIGIVGCLMLNPGNTPQPLGLQITTSPLSEIFSQVVSSNLAKFLGIKYLCLPDPRKNQFLNKLYGGCLLARRETLEQVGWFDERYFMYCEDVDLCRTAVKAGWKLYYLADTKIIHLGGAASAKAPSDFAILMKCDSLSKLMLKYYGKIGLKLYASSILAFSALRYLLLQAATLCGLSLIARNRAGVRDSIRKQKVLIAWSMGRRMANIPK